MPHGIYASLESTAIDMGVPGFDSDSGFGLIQADGALAAAALLPAISINDISIPEGDSGTSNFVFTVSLSTATEQTVSVNYSTANNTATAGSDYVATSGTLTFNPGDTTKTITVS